MRIGIQIVLTVAILILGWLVWESIAEPIRFQKAKATRDVKVIERLKDIRKAEVAFNQKHKRFTASWDSLIQFITNDSIFEVIKEGQAPDTMSERKALELGLIRRDTMKMPAFEVLFKSNRKKLDSIRYVPNTGGKEIELWSGTFVSQDGQSKVPIFEAAVPFKVYLDGLAKQEIINFKLESERLGQYPGLKVGTREEPNNNSGNWIEVEED